MVWFLFISVPLDAVQRGPFHIKSIKSAKKYSPIFPWVLIRPIKLGKKKKKQRQIVIDGHHAQTIEKLNYLWWTYSHNGIHKKGFGRCRLSCFLHYIQYTLSIYLSAHKQLTRHLQTLCLNSPVSTYVCRSKYCQVGLEKSFYLNTLLESFCQWVKKR